MILGLDIVARVCAVYDERVNCFLRMVRVGINVSDFRWHHIEINELEKADMFRAIDVQFMSRRVWVVSGVYPTDLWFIPSRTHRVVDLDYDLCFHWSHLDRAIRDGLGYW